MKNLYTYLFLIPVLLVLAGCADEYLDEPPEYSIDSENFFNSEDDYDQALLAAYDLLAAVGYVSTITAEIASDNVEAGGESATDVIAWQEINTMTHTPVNDQLRNIWNWNYAGINRCNYIFEFQDKTDFEGRTQVLAETAFLRAYYYFQLVKFFGDLPMPLDKRVLFGEASELPRLPKAEVYTQIETDLTFAAANLNPIASQAGRATRGAALALLGKVHLYQDEFDDAATQLQTVINEGQYDLFGDITSLFLDQNENSIESVFEIQYSNAQGAGFECLQCSEGNVMIGFSGIRGYSGPVYASGFSFNVPRQELVDDFEAGDLRFGATILDIDEWIIANPGPDDDPTTFVEGFDHTGYFNNKYLPRQGEADQPDVNLTYPNNIRQIRYADVLLMAAEALNRGGGDDAQALAYVNQVRARADLSTISVSGNELTQAIYQERRVELAGEGHRFFDLVRTGNAAAEIDGFQTGKHEVFPIPLIEIQLGGDVWPQNANY
ncbi:MAG: RagB/SusD family nutrient uptake outer membrane protein [Bacteroidota bacterium]